MTKAIVDPVHPDYQQVIRERHSRPAIPIAPQSICEHIAFRRCDITEGFAQSGWQQVAALLNLEVQFENSCGVFAKHQAMSLKWEQHTEFFVV